MIHLPALAMTAIAQLRLAPVRQGRDLGSGEDRRRIPGARLLLSLSYAGAAIGNWRSLIGLLNAPAESVLHRLLHARPEIWQMVRAPFVSVTWPARTRFVRIVDHCRIATSLGAPFDLLPNEYADLLHLPEIGPGYRLTIDQPRWLVSDGLLALSLWEGGDRLYSLAFTFAREDDWLITYIGGIQGRRGDTSRDRYRAFTRAAHGVRPSDMLIALFRMMCAQLGVAAIFGVSDATRHQRSQYFTGRRDFVDPVTFDYDLLWRERGAAPRADGFFDLPVIAPVREEADIPARKRSLYRQRAAMLAGIRARLAIALAAGGGIRIEQHEPAWL